MCFLLFSNVQLNMKSALQADSFPKHRSENRISEETKVHQCLKSHKNQEVNSTLALLFTSKNLRSFFSVSFHFKSKQCLTYKASKMRQLNRWYCAPLLFTDIFYKPMHVIKICISKTAQTNGWLLCFFTSSETSVFHIYPNG